MSAPVQRPAYLQRIATSLIPPAVVIPGALLFSVMVLYKFRRCWRWMRIGLLWSNPDNFVQLSAGAGINLLFGDKLPIRVAALMVWIPSRVVDCGDEYHKLGRAYQKWREAIRGDYPLSPTIRWVKSSHGRHTTPSFELYWKQKGAIMRMRAGLVVKRTYRLGARIFVLSMVANDAVDALSLKKSICDRAVNEFVLDGTNAIERIASKKEEIQQKLEENRLLMNKILKKMQVHYTVDRLISCVSQAMDGIEIVDQGVKSVTGLGSGMVRDGLKHALFGALSVLGLPKMISEKWLPGEWEAKHFEAHPDEQYVPAQWRTQPAFAANNLPNAETLRKIEIEVRRRPAKTPKPVQLAGGRQSPYRLVPVVRAAENRMGG